MSPSRRPKTPPRRSGSSSTSCARPRRSPQALSAGYRRVLCCAEIEEARRLREEIEGSLVGGERDAQRIEGFDVGASPREFLEPRADTLILSTTNGTRTILTAA